MKSHWWPMNATWKAQSLRLPGCEMFCPSPPPPVGYVKLHELLSFGENDTGVEIRRCRSSFFHRFVVLSGPLLEPERREFWRVLKGKARAPAYMCAEGWTGTPVHSCGLLGLLLCRWPRYVEPQRLRSACATCSRCSRPKNHGFSMVFSCFWF